MYSNCLLEALKAKIKNPKQTRIHAVPAKFNPLHTPFPHFWWSIDGQAYEFISDKDRKFQVVLFKGHVETRTVDEMKEKIRRLFRLYTISLSKKYGDAFEDDKVYFTKSDDFKEPKVSGDSSPTIIIYYKKDNKVFTRLIDSRNFKKYKNVLAWRDASTEGSEFIIRFKLIRNEDKNFF